MLNGNLSVDTQTRRVEVDGVSADLEPKVYDLLVFLLRHANEVATKDRLIEEVWQGRVVSDGALTQTIAKLRKALGELGHEGGLIKTVPKVGYRWEGEVVEPEETTAPAPAAPAKRGTAPRAAWIAGAVVALALLVTLFLPTATSEQVTVAMMPFASAADADLEWAQLGLPVLIGDTFGARTKVRVVSASRVRSSLRSLGLTPDAPLEERLAAVRSLMGADHLLQAQVDRSGGTYQLSYSLDSVDSDRITGAIESKRLDDLAYDLVAEVSETLDVQYEAGIPVRKISNADYINETFARGMQALLSGDSQGARTYFETALAGDEDMHWARYELGNALQFLGQWDDAREAYSLVISRAQEEADYNLAGAAASGLGVIAWRQGDLSGAESFFESAREWFAGVDNRANLASALGNLGILADNRQAWDDARQLYGEALSLYRTEGERFGESAVYSNLAVLERKLGQIDKAAEFQAKAIDIQKRVGLNQMLVFSLNHAGTIDTIRGNWDQASAWLDQASTLAAEQDDPVGVADAQSGLADLMLDQLRVDEAETLLNSALETYTELGNKFAEGRTRLMLARVAALRGDNVSVLAMSQPAVVIAEELSDDALRLGALLINARAQPGEPGKAILVEAQTIARDLDSELELARVELTRSFINPDDLDSAREAVRLARNAGDRRLEATASIELGLKLLRTGTGESVGALLAAAESWQPNYYGAMHLRACYLQAEGDLQAAQALLDKASGLAAEAPSLAPLECG